MTDFGTDVSAYPEISPTLTLISGYALVAQAVCRRLVTPRGTLFWDTDYGSDITALLNGRVDPTRIFQIETMVQAEALKDDRVQACDVSSVWNPVTSTLSLRLTITTADGPFLAVLAASSVTVDLLSVTKASS